MMQQTTQEPWPVWARVLITLVAVLVVVTLIPWLFMGVAMAAGCSPMMGGSMQMPGMPMMR
jgi:uncharacterized membrane protein